MNNEDDRPILFKKFPELEENIPWTRIGSFPTPVQKLKHLACDNLWIKRDDLSSPTYGGNKIRKLEFILGEVIERKKKHVVTIGAIGTNHGLATAIHCNRLGINCTLILFKQPVTPNVKQNLLLFKKFNASAIYKKTMLRTVLSFYITRRLRNPNAYFLFAGGSNIQGTIGFVNAAFELKSQVEQGLIPEPSHIFCPAGSNGTAAGLMLGTLLAGLDTTLIGVRVTPSHLGPLQTCTGDTVRRLAESTYNYLKQRCRDLPEVSITTPALVEDQFGEGYGCITDECRDAYHLLKDKEDINLDPTYTSKTFAAVLDHCKTHPKNSRPVLYWHTYNSVDMSSHTASVDYRDLPKKLQRFIEEEEITL